MMKNIKKFFITQRRKHSDIQTSKKHIKINKTEQLIGKNFSDSLYNIKKIIKISKIFMKQIFIHLILSNNSNTNNNNLNQ